MPTLLDSRCQVSIPLEITGQDSELCAADASFVCENCGPICSHCAETFPCPLTSHGKHLPAEPLQPTTPTAPQFVPDLLLTLYFISCDPFRNAQPCWNHAPLTCLLCGKPENLTTHAGIVFTDFLKWNQLHMDCALTLDSAELTSGKYFAGGGQ